MDDVQKSRRDDTLLTAGFSLRTEYPPPLPSPAGTTLAAATGIWISSVVPAGLFIMLLPFVRRLKPAVNKVPSLRDLLRMRQFETKIGAVKRQFGAVKRQFDAVNCSH